MSTAQPRKFNRCAVYAKKCPKAGPVWGAIRPMSGGPSLVLFPRPLARSSEDFPAGRKFTRRWWRRRRPGIKRKRKENDSPSLKSDLCLPVCRRWPGVARYSNIAGLPNRRHWNVALRYRLLVVPARCSVGRLPPWQGRQNVEKPETGQSRGENGNPQGES